MIDQIQNLENLGSVRGKLNEVIVDVNALNVTVPALQTTVGGVVVDVNALNVDVAGLQATEGLSFNTVPDLLADSSMIYGFGDVLAGNIVQTRSEGFSYQIATSSAVNQHVTTAGGVKLYVLPDAEGWRPLQAFGAVGNGVANDTAIVQLALDVSPYLKGQSGAVYKIFSTVIIPNNRWFDGNGCMFLKGFRSGAAGATQHFVLRNKDSYSTDPTPWTGENVFLKDIWIEDDGTSATRGSMLLLSGTNMVLDGFKIRQSAPEESLGGNAAQISGKNIQIYRVDIDNWDAGIVCDALHFGYVEDLVVQGGVIRSGDDSIAFHPQPLNFPWSGPDKLAKNIFVSGLVLSTATSNGVRLGGWGLGENLWPPHVNTVFHNVLIDVVIGQCGGYAVNLEELRTAAELSSGNRHTGITVRARIEKQLTSIRMVQVNGNIDITDVANVARHGFENVDLYIEGEQSDLAATFPLLRAGGVDRLRVYGTFEADADTPSTFSACTFFQIDHLIMDGVVTKGDTTGTFASFKWVENIDIRNPIHLSDGTSEFQTYSLTITPEVPMSFSMSDGRVEETTRFINIAGTGRMKRVVIDGTRIESTNAPNWATLFATTTWESGAVFAYRPAGGYAATVATLPGSAIPVVEGNPAFATNGRKSGEGVGAGTGQPVYRNGTVWRCVRDDSVVLA